MPLRHPDGEHYDVAMSTDDLAARLTDLNARISDACAAASRPRNSVQLLLATKTLSTERTLAAVAAGGVLLGESRVQEVTAKGPELATLSASMPDTRRPRVHLIGHLQSNKINAVLPWVDCIESIDSLRLAQRVSDRVLARAAADPAQDDAGAPRQLDVFLQVNVSGEESKFGVAPDAAPEIAAQVGELAGLHLAGFMTIGANSTDTALVRAAYARLREIRDNVVASGAPGTKEATELSMGMSRSFEDAIAEGATIVRVGTALFGPRPV